MSLSSAESTDSMVSDTRVKRAHMPYVGNGVTGWSTEAADLGNFVFRTRSGLQN